METYINFTIKHVLSIEKAKEPDVYWVLFDDPSDISIYGPFSDEAEQKFRHAVKTCVKVHKGFGWPIYRERYCIRMRIEFDGPIFDEFLGNALATGRVDGILTINEANDVCTIYKFEITRVNPRTAFTINRVVEIRTARSDDNKFLIFFERDENGEPNIDIYSEDHDTISAINKKLKKSSLTKRYYLVVYTSGNITEPHCKDGLFTADGYIDANKDIIMTSYEEVNLRDATVADVYNGMTVWQQKVVQFMIGEALKNAIKSFTPDSIKKVIYNDPATIIFWSDGTKTIVKCMEDDDYDPEKGFMAAVTKKVFGDKYGWVMRHQVKPEIEKEDKVDALTNAFADALRDQRMIKENTIGIRAKMEASGATHWELETFDRFVRKYIADKEDK